MTRLPPTRPLSKAFTDDHLSSSQSPVNRTVTTRNMLHRTQAWHREASPPRLILFQSPQPNM